MTYPFTLGYECLLSLMWQCLNNCCDENCCLVTLAGVTTPWAHLLIVFSCSHLFTFLFFQVLSTPPLFLHSFCTLFWFVVFFGSHSGWLWMHSDFLFDLCFPVTFFSTPPSLQIFFLHFHIHWIYLSYLVAMDDEAMEVFVMSCLLLLIQMVQQMFQSSLAILPSLETLEQLLRHSP